MESKTTSDASQASDEELVRLVRCGEREHFAHLAQRHEKIVFRIVHGILGNPADSEEVLQESFLKALQHIGDFRGEAQFRTWLIQIAINEARMRLRKYRPYLYDSIDEEPDDTRGFRPRELRDWRPNPEEKLEEAELRGLLESATRALPPIYRAVFLLRDVEHLSNKETSQALGISVAATKARLHRARLMMREYLAPHFQKRLYQELFDRFARHRRQPMTRCEEVIRELSNYIDADVTEDLRRRIEEHLRDCHDCTVVVNTIRKTLSLVCNTRILELPADVSQRLMERLASHGGKSLEDSDGNARTGSDGHENGARDRD